jgi:hypothetical protein
LRRVPDAEGLGAMRIRKVIAERLDLKKDRVDVAAAIDAVVAVNVNEEGEEPDREEASEHGRDEAPHP